MKTKNILVFGILLVFTFFSLVSADVISINSGGDNQLIINPDTYLEGFFFMENGMPVISSLILNSSLGLNTTNENLSVYFSGYDPDEDFVTNITDWRLNGNSIAVLNMPFDKNVVELTTGAIRDYSSYGNNGTLGGGSSASAPGWNSTGKIGGKYIFDGANDYLSVSHDSSLNIENEITISVWINAAEWESNYWEGTIVGKDDWNDGDSHGYVLRTGNNGRLSFTIAQDNSPNWLESLTSQLMSVGNWYHLVGTFNGTHLMTYIDGDLKDTTVISQTLIETSTYNLGIGQSPYDISRRFNGSIDEVKIYNVSLSGEQIVEIYASENSGYQMKNLVSQETEKGETWQVAVTPNDGLIDGATVLSGNLTILDSAPEDPTQVNLVSVDASNESDIDLNCSAFISDVDNSLLDVEVKWIKDDINQFTFDYSSQVNGTIFYNILDSGNLTLGDVWKCSVRTYDGNSYSSWVNSSSLTIIDITNPVVLIDSPLSNEIYNYTTLEVDFNVSLIENENMSVCLYSLDGDSNVTMTEINDSYFFSEPNLGPGPHTVDFSCNDTSGNWGFNSTDFEILNEAAIAIDLSTELGGSIIWNIVILPVNNLDAFGNNGSGNTEYWVNVSATNTNVDLYVRADGDLLTVGLDEIGLGNETFAIALNDQTVNNNTNLTMQTSYIKIGNNLVDLDAIYIKFFLDAPTGQAAGQYLNSLEFKAVRNGQVV
ncbi:LamG domain-containing protein [archaeon]|jgi:hypothetical protein|nr:LamG domain-containing protein [archaeon]